MTGKHARNGRRSAKKRASRGRAATAGAKKAARKPAGTKPGAKAGIRKEAGRPAAAARGKRATRSKTIGGGKIASALQAMVDAVADSDLLHGRSRSRTE